MSKIQDAFPALGRRLFEHEKPAVEAFNKKYESFSQDEQCAESKMHSRDSVPRVNVPASLYKNVADGLMERVLEIEQLVDRMSWSGCDLRVAVGKDVFDCIYNDEYVKQTFQYFVRASSPECEDLAPGKRWIKVSKTLFVEE